MLDPRRTISLILLIAGFLGLFGFAVHNDAIYSQHPQTMYQSGEGSKSTPPRLSIPESAEERIANYTWWLGAFTFALVIVSALQIFFLTRADKTARISADAATLVAKASIGVELPRFVLKSVQIKGLPDNPRRALETGGMIITFCNLGRTAAVVAIEYFDWRVCGALPETPGQSASNYRATDLGTIVEPNGGEYEMQSPRGGLAIAGDIPEGDITRILRAEDTLWVYGAIGYRDFLGERHVARFCTRLEIWHARFSDSNELDRGMILSMRFVADGPLAYQ